MNRADRADACRRMLAAHMSYNDISQALKMSTRTISAISRGERGYSDAKVGRPAKLTREMKMFINVNWLADARITDATMTCMVNDHFRTQAQISAPIASRSQSASFRPDSSRGYRRPLPSSSSRCSCRWGTRHVPRTLSAIARQIWKALLCKQYWKSREQPHGKPLSALKLSSSIAFLRIYFPNLATSLHFFVVTYNKRTDFAQKYNHVISI